jgi:hypothetical protein
MLLSFPGLLQPLRWSFTLAQGIAPSAFVVEVAPQSSLPSAVGAVEFTAGEQPMRFERCVLDRASLRRTRSGAVVAVTLLDRRWRWGFTRITGWYNQRQPNGRLVPHRERSPRQLATRLLEALGETEFDVADLPNGFRPEVQWRGANPAVELDRLCELLGCRVVLGLNDRIALRRVGAGALLPNPGVETRETLATTPANRPQSLTVVGGPTRFQTRFRLAAVGLEPTGEIVPIDQLSYRPATGFSAEYPHWGQLPEPARGCALASLYRWYRVVSTDSPAGSPTWQIPGCDVPVNDLWQLLPLDAELQQFESPTGGVPRRRPAIVEGLYFAGGCDGRNHELSAPVTTPWELDGDRGLVRFATPVVRRTTGGEIAPAELALTTGHGVQRAEEGAPVRWELTHALDNGPGAVGTRVVVRGELSEVVLGAPGTSEGEPTANRAEPETNRAELDLEATTLLAEVAAEWQARGTADVEYAGLLAISPDGAIEQVEFRVGPEGATTRASRNAEFAHSLAPHTVRRQQPRLWQLASQ